MSVYELGGFAQYPEDIYGDETDFNAFNYCLAEDYYFAMIKEDFKALGDMSTYLFNEIEYWLNYDGKIAEEKNQK